MSFMPRMRYLAVVGIIPVLFVTLFIDPRVADTGAGDPVTPEPTIAVELPISPTFTPFIPAPVLPTRAPAAPTPKASAINGISLDRIVVLPQAVQQHIRTIFAQGQALGRNPRAFSKVGDSTMAYPPFLAAFDRTFKLGPFTPLQTTIEHYAGSFARESLAVKKGMHTWSEFDPSWADPKLCQAGEGPLACELRVQNPSVVIIRLGANDVSTPKYFEQQLRRIIDLGLAKGIVTVLGTKPDRLEGPDNTLNKIIANVAREYNVPLWDYDLVAGTVPGKGLGTDKVHFKGGGSHDYTTAASFAAADSLEDLTGLAALDAIYREVIGTRGH